MAEDVPPESKKVWAWGDDLKHYLEDNNCKHGDKYNASMDRREEFYARFSHETQDRYGYDIEILKQDRDLFTTIIHALNVDYPCSYIKIGFDQWNGIYAHDFKDEQRFTVECGSITTGMMYLWLLFADKYPEVEQWVEPE